MEQKYPALLLLFTFLFASCANQIALTGGDRDSEPPILVLSEPLNGSVNIRTKVLRFEFNEFVQLKNSGQIFTSPIIEGGLKYTASGKVVLVKLPMDKLKDSLTYFINFRDCIVDNNEANAINNFTYHFSTYNVIDSFSVSGVIRRAETKEFAKNVVVGLYRTRKNHIDSLKPLYLGFTNDEGFFSIKHIKEGRYLLSAIEDLNKDYKLQVNEFYGFATNYLDVNNILDSVDLEISENRNIPWLNQLDVESFSKPIIVFSKPIDYFELFNKAGKELPYNISSSRDTAFIRREIHTDFILLKHLKASFDTLKVVPKAKREIVKEELQLKLGSEKIKGKRVVIKCSSRIDTVNVGAFHFMKDSTELKIDSVVVTNKNSVILFITKPEGLESASISIDSGAFVGVNKTSNKFSSSIAFVRQEDLGKIEFIGNKKGLLLELLDEKGNLIRRRYTKGTGEITFNGLYEGIYNLKVIVDANGNRIWDSADFENLEQAESIKYFGPYQLSKGWELLGNVIELE